MVDDGRARCGRAACTQQLCAVDSGHPSTAIPSRRRRNEGSRCYHCGPGPRALPIRLHLQVPRTVRSPLLLLERRDAFAGRRADDLQVYRQMYRFNQHYRGEMQARGGGGPSCRPVKNWVMEGGPVRAAAAQCWWPLPHQGQAPKRGFQGCAAPDEDPLAATLMRPWRSALAPCPLGADICVCVVCGGGCGCGWGGVWCVCVVVGVGWGGAGKEPVGHGAQPCSGMLSLMPIRLRMLCPHQIPACLSQPCLSQPRQKPSAAGTPAPPGGSPRGLRRALGRGRTA